MHPKTSGDPICYKFNKTKLRKATSTISTPVSSDGEIDILHRDQIHVFCVDDCGYVESWACPHLHVNISTFRLTQVAYGTMRGMWGVTFFTVRPRFKEPPGGSA